MVQIRYIFGPKEAGPTRLPVVATEAVLANSAQLRRTRTRYLWNVALLTVSMVVVTLELVALLRKVCALKEENLRLRKEHQKNQYLKQIIKQSVPEEVFLTKGMQMNMVLMDTDSSPATPERSWYNVNLRMLWTSDKITRCDMATMAHMLATEIYAHRPDPDQADTARMQLTAENNVKESLDTIVKAEAEKKIELPMKDIYSSASRKTMKFSR